MMTEPVRLDSKGRDVSKESSPQSGIGELIKVIIQAVVIAAVVRTFLFQPFNIPSGSMIPNLLIGDYLFVSKYSYGFSKYSFPVTFDFIHGRVLASAPHRGDVIVFKQPKYNELDYIKRLVGLPGETVQVTNGRLYINGQIVPREKIADFPYGSTSGGTRNVPQYKETLPGGVTHTIIEIEGDQGLNDNTELFTVPRNSYFMMGDNRDDSADSRVPPEEKGVGYVPAENLEGRAELIFFSVGQQSGVGEIEPAWKFWLWPWTVRWDRVFKPVH